MTAYSGVVSIDHNDIPVVIDIDENGIRMIAAGTEIGSWGADEYQIARLGRARYGITAEDETLLFLPSEPGAFDMVVNGHSEPSAVAHSQRGRHLAQTSSGNDLPVAPPPKTTTMIAFYALCAFTAALGVWSLIRVIF